ncbi:adenosylhomocysteinase [Morganella morganii]|uniref:adenosylhomocysteinase n=1 Tax=Morganella morganii TaxID=582 RepID=UPI0006674165|nr:adenosylhomocysteinase [Morganella morganii]SSN05863.1 adenosylhomocysteinase [Klebsiella pneumoniae]EJD6110711.1 adenosylhomocysteinase [Morganella morganii]EJG2205279.1 adenosylhomocysteinase [Morganella morganii]EKU4014937.1 adenosylhomocysteinase [Morganella morganii]ELA7702105.1 adenosylhomocysteinase [Morganella morganii]
MVTSIYKDLSLAPQGEQKIAWVRAHMPLLRALEQRFTQEQPFAGKRIALSIHLEAKTAYLARVLAAGGAEVSVTGSNPMSTKDDIVAALVVSGIHTFAIHGADAEAYRNFVKQTLACEPHIVIDDGGDLVHELHSLYPEYAKHTIGACEETTTGVLRAVAREKNGALNFPVLSINGAQSKHLFDNRYGTGQSTFDGIMRTTNLVIAGKTVVVAGYGWCGKGCAMRAKGLGAEVIVTEVDPIKALEAKMDGFAVMTMSAAAPLGDIFITATGCCDVLTSDHFSLMKESAIISNTGHFEDEINLTDLQQLSDSVTIVRENIEGYTLKNGRTLYLLGRGALVNIACADGHPAEIMDMSFALQALSAEYLLSHDHEAKVYDVSDEIDREVAALKLQDMGVSLDNLTTRQQQYLNGYELK